MQCRRYKALNTAKVMYQKSEPLLNKESKLENTNHRQDSSLRSRNGGRQTDYGFCDNRKSLTIGRTKDYGSTSLKLSISTVSVRQRTRPLTNDKNHSDSDKAKSPTVKNIKF